MKENDEKYSTRWYMLTRNDGNSSIKCRGPVLVKNNALNKINPPYHLERSVAIQRKGDKIDPFDGWLENVHACM
jgi:hypothetical protein